MSDPRQRQSSAKTPSQSGVADSGATGGDSDTGKPALRQRLRRYVIAFPLYAASLAFLLGIIAWGGFNWSMEMTNQESFCISCHVMRDNVYEEYKRTAHYHNPAGVRATCPDCHVPKDWIHKVIRKVRGTNELYHWAIGTIDTREKFLVERNRLAAEVWRFMRDSDSRECRNCHHFEFMDTEGQNPAAAARHQKARTDGMTCMDCHIGITHELPEQLLDAEHKRFEQDKGSCWNCHTDQPDPKEQGEWDWDTLE